MHCFTLEKLDQSRSLFFMFVVSVGKQLTGKKINKDAR